MKYRVLIYVMIALILMQVDASAQTLMGKIVDLEVISGEYVDGVNQDWLVDKIDVKARLFRNQKGNELVLSNGLVSRTFRISPNCATTSIKKLTNQEELIRAIKPEAILQIENYSIEVGGLSGQANLAFLFPDWIDEMDANPMSFTLVDYTVGDPEKRFEWKEVRHHAPDTEWPPKGIHLSMEYKFNDIPTEDLLKISQESSTGREALISDDFTTLSNKWKVRTSETHERSSFINEGKPGEIYTLKNTAVYAEQALPKSVGLVETFIDRGTDLSGSWGPGIALIWDDRTIKFNLKEGSEDGINRSPFKLIVYDGKRENGRAGGKVDVSFDQAVGMRLRIDGNKVFCEIKPTGRDWQTIEIIDFGKDVPDPVAVRIGKLGRKAEGVDHEIPGELIRMKIKNFAAYGRVNSDKNKSLKESLNKLKEISVYVNYELYDGIPLMSKWLDIKNNSNKPIALNNIVSEALGFADFDPYDGYAGMRELLVRPNVLIDTDYAFGAQRQKVAAQHSVHWEKDPEYITQINYHLEIENYLKVYPENGYNISIEPGDTFSSIRAFFLTYDSQVKERQGLSMRRMYRTIAPWVTENPMMFHLTRNKWDDFTLAVDQCAELGYEMINFSFGSGFNAEDNSEKNYAQIRKYVDYAGNKGITLGTYSLLASRRVSEKDDVINPATGKRGGFAKFGNSPCLGSEWGLEYFDKMYSLFNETGLMTFTHDGSYPGDVCASTTHPGHKGLGDSQYRQWEIISNFYKWLKGQGVYLRVPDYYYLVGSNHNAIGYRENNWSLPRRQQLIHTRQNIHDGTMESIPSMRWSFVPLQQYHGGGATATVEPLHEHLDHYEMMLASNLGMGIQAVLRGPRLYDTEETKAMVMRVVDWFKKYRGILESDIIHLRRADGRDIDYMMHVNPQLKEKGFLMVFNPTDQVIRKKITVPLYYTGLKDSASIREQENSPHIFKLDREYNIEIEVEIEPNWYNWYVIGELGN